MEKLFFVPAKELAAQLETVRGSHRLRRRPAMPCCARVAPVAPRGLCTIYPRGGGAQGRQKHPWRLLDNALELRWAAAGEVGRGVSVVATDCRKVLSDDRGATGVI